ncbi:bifunctional riboflavin kinase/FAD synthetase [Thauera humireducens]|uniref:bifunctional riboflavin kinase/FAD synthetase n=1 Tax=Thauera humireducens TaxID=1134435 RepID=UPI003C7945BD
MLTIGNFDGVHLGHQALLKLLTDKARSPRPAGCRATFEPHPREYFSPSDAPACLASLREKLLLLDAAGVDRTYVCRFDARFASQTAQAFIEDTLVRGLGVRHLFVGDDFCFGARRQGNFAMLQAAGDRHGFGVESMPTLGVQGERVSSSAVREALGEDDLEHAARLLGRPYSIAGRVSHGDKIGRQLGFPTANIQMKHRRPALTGVYAVGVEGLAGKRIAGVANIGVRPTATSAGRARLEVHLFDWTQSCYGAHIRVHFLHKLRAERKFESLDALRTQIALDADIARQWFADQPDRLQA